MGLGDVSLRCAWGLVDELVRGGMHHACVSPGSRSTPIALALARHGDVKVHVHLDERSSAFFALGVSKATGAPVAVACTSGTAATELYPAVVEASQSRVPLLLLTADRPPRLRGTGANQTIDQVELYGRYARDFVDLPVPEDDETAVAWRVAAIRALEAAGGTPSGPVQLNLPFEEPLFPDEGARWSAAGSWVAGSWEVGEPVPLPVTEAFDVERAVRELSAARGVVVVGSMPSPPALTTMLADRLGWPVLAEPLSGARTPGRSLRAGQALVADEDWLGAHLPEAVLQLGATPTTRATQRLVASTARLVVVDRHHPDPDPERRAVLRIVADAELVAGTLLELPVEPSSQDWLDSWLRADDAARSAMDALMDTWDEPYEGRVARDLAAAIPDGGTLVVGSSMPVRDLDDTMEPRDGMRVLANRGASGIDGFVSTVLGVAASGAPTYGLMGDLTFLHDVGALMWCARRGYDATLVVNNNRGGAIFSFLPQRALPEHEQLFTTPHGLDLGFVCAAAGAGHVRIERAADLVPAVERAVAAGGVRVVEVAVDPELNLVRHAEVQAAVTAALRGLT